MGRSCILDPPPQRQGGARGGADARSSGDAGLSQQKVQRREANRCRHRLTEPTTKALCQPPPPPALGCQGNGPGGGKGVHPTGPTPWPDRKASPAAPAARDSGNCRGTEELVPVVNRICEWGAVIATFLSVLSIGPRHCARLADFLHPKLKEVMRC